MKQYQHKDSKGDAWAVAVGVMCLFALLCSLGEYVFKHYTWEEPTVKVEQTIPPAPVDTLY